MTDEHSNHGAEVEEHDLGLVHDLGTLGRRGLLGLFGGLGAVAVVGCAADDDGATTSPDSTSSRAAGPGAPGGAPPDGMGGDSSVEVADGEIPEETAGPFPGDGSNGPNVLSESGIVRSDLTRSFGSASGVAEGVPVTVRMRVYDLTGDDIALLPGAALYLWHCDRDGNYSMYSEGVTEENYLRGVQAADDDGWVEFTTIFPACYQGRWPHMHFEVYPSLEEATSAENKLRTSQLAIPEDTCREVYGVVEGYGSSVQTLAGVTLDSDGIFSDGHSLQMAKVTGSVDEGYTLTLNVPI